MSSRYSIVQYVPIPIAEERINIGVIAFDDRTVLVHFLKNWNRVINFGGEGIGFLLNFAKRMEESAKAGLLFPGDVEDSTPRYDRFQAYAAQCQNSIQFTEPRGSLQDVEALFKETIETFLVDIPEEDDDEPNGNRMNQVETEYTKFYDRNINRVRDICAESYSEHWRVLARQWGESDDQGRRKQFYFFVRKLKSLNKELDLSYLV